MQRLLWFESGLKIVDLMRGNAIELLTVWDQVITQTGEQTWYFLPILLLVLHTAL